MAGRNPYLELTFPRTGVDYISDKNMYLSTNRNIDASVI